MGEILILPRPSTQMMDNRLDKKHYDLHEKIIRFHKSYIEAFCTALQCPTTEQRTNTHTHTKTNQKVKENTNILLTAWKCSAKRKSYDQKIQCSQNNKSILSHFTLSMSISIYGLRFATTKKKQSAASAHLSHQGPL